jgi:hypothetical protein
VSIFKNVIISASNIQKENDPMTCYLFKHAINYYKITVLYTMQDKQFCFLQMPIPALRPLSLQTKEQLGVCARDKVAKA